MTASAPLLRIGTRRSALALAQTRAFRADAARALGLAGPAIEARLPLVEMVTSGDRHAGVPLADIGGKGLFTRELDEALLSGRIDAAVHSLKDIPGDLPSGIVIAAVLKREDPRDVLVSPLADRLLALPRGARVGTSAPRRRAQLLRLRPDLDIRLLRGNVDTRLKKLAEGEVDAAILAAAGLNRLGLHETARCPIPPEEMLPAGGQGLVAITCRADDEAALAILAPLGDPEGQAAAACERAFIAALDGSCRTALAAHAETLGGRIAFRAAAYAADGTKAHFVTGAAPLAGA
ncbi:MAG: hydroxymethylbilane synthase, partial [Alphaproteobacteria bacterium]|nr:hydroxymethylbilane synthase [Alphaproteobacteria bacterium]